MCHDRPSTRLLILRTYRKAHALAPGPHFVFAPHDDHGFVAAFASSMPPHLAHWLLFREQFEPVVGEPGLFRLTQPERDGPRRTRQAVRDLRRQGYAVHADRIVDPAALARPQRPAQSNRLVERRSRLAQAAVGRSPQRGPAPAASPRTAGPVPPKPAYAPTVHLTASANGRNR